MALKTPYCTVTEANAYLRTNDAWTSLSVTEKDAHLLNGRYYIDSNYTCSEIDETAIPDEFKYANALLAEADLATSIFTVDETGGSPVLGKRVKAGSVESETIYAGSRSTSPRLGAVDPYPKVTSILSAYCSNKKSSTLKISSLQRA